MNKKYIKIYCKTITYHLILLLNSTERMKKIFYTTVLLLAGCYLPSCDYAHANVNTLITEDCGVKWTLIKAGESIPKGVANPCHYKVTIPDYPMQGDSKFKVMFAENVLSTIDVGYDYTITDPILFIKEAKYLGKTNNTDVNAQFEGAENMVIDKRIKDVIRGLISTEDVVTFSPSDFEDKILPNVNKVLNPLGININYLSFVPLFDEQTAQAIDVATAMKIYKSKGLEAIGEKVMQSKAGATRITVENTTSKPKASTEGE
jgi:hypothetical protein